MSFDSIQTKIDLVWNDECPECKLTECEICKFPNKPLMATLTASRSESIGISLTNDQQDEWQTAALAIFLRVRQDMDATGIIWMQPISSSRVLLYDAVCVLWMQNPMQIMRNRFRAHRPFIAYLYGVGICMCFRRVAVGRTNWADKSHADWGSLSMWSFLDTVRPRSFDSVCDKLVTLRCSMSSGQWEYITGG